MIKGLSESMILVAEVCGQTCHGRLTMNLSSNLPVETSQSESLLLIVIAPIKIKVEGYFTLSTCGNNDLGCVLSLSRELNYICSSLMYNLKKVLQSRPHLQVLSFPCKFAATSQCSYNLLAIF